MTARNTGPKRSPDPPADKVLLALHCLADRNMTVTASEAEIAAQARVPEADIVPALEDLEARELLQAFRKRKHSTSWLVTLAYDPNESPDAITVPWSDPIAPSMRRNVDPEMPPDLPLPFFCQNRKVARSILKIIAGLQSLARDGWCRATLAEISGASGMRDVNTVKFHLAHLEAEGMIRVHHGHEFGRARRAFEILRFVEVPPEVWPGTTPGTGPRPTPEPYEPDLATPPRGEPAAPPRTTSGLRPIGGRGQMLFAWADGTV